MTPRESWHERLGRWLLCRVLPSEAADDFLDDLEEEMAHRRQRGSLGLRDRIWFWRQIVSLDVLRLRRELVGRRRGLRALALPSLRTDTKYAIRALIREHRLTVAAVLSLALGIGAVSMMFGFIRPFIAAVPPLEGLERVAFVWSTNAARGTSRSVTSLQDFADWRDGSGTFETLAAWQSEDANLASGADSMRVSVRRVTSGYFPTLGIEADLGRALQPMDGDPSSPRVVVFSQNVWRTSFGADPAVIGRRVTLDGEPAQVVGVMPAGLDTLGGDVWVPLGGIQDGIDRGQRAAFVIGRLREGVAFEQAGADLARIAGRLENEYPATNRGWGVRVVPFAEDFLGSELQLALGLLAIASFFVLAIACVNVSNLLLARAEERRHELAMRSALGAGPARLGALLLIESALLGVAGGLAGLVVSFGGLRLLRAVFPSGTLPPDTTGFDVVLFALAAGAALVSSLLIGTLPAWRVRRTDVRSVFGEGGRAMAGGRSRIQAVLVAAQVALSVLLLVITGLLLRTVIGFQQVPPGFDPHHLVTMRVDLPESEYPHDAQIVRFFDSAIARIGALPAVVAAGATTRLPIAGSRNNPIRTIVVDGRPADGSGDTPWALDFSVTPAYLQALGVPLIAGRWLAAADVEAAQPVAVVSETLAARYWTDGNALGGRLAIGDPGPDPQWITVVGIAGDVRNDDVDQPPLPQIYRPLAQAPERSMAFLVRTARDPADMVAAVREEIRAVDARQPLYDVRTMEQIVDDDTAGSSAFVSVLGVFGGMALLLAAGGMLGVASRAAAGRRQEVGIRLALGARRGHVCRLMIGRGLVAVAIGALFGIAAALGVTQLMAGILFGVGPADPLTYGTVLAILIATALAASVGPAMRSLRRDPLRSLRYE